MRIIGLEAMLAAWIVLSPLGGTAFAQAIHGGRQARTIGLTDPLNECL